MNTSAAIADPLLRQVRPAGSPLGPSPYCTSTHLVLTAPHADLATRLSDFATNRHESCGLALEDHHPIIFAFFFQEHLDLFFP
jgi:hypothetical protein